MGKSVEVEQDGKNIHRNLDILLEVVDFVSFSADRVEKRSYIINYLAEVFGASPVLCDRFFERVVRSSSLRRSLVSKVGWGLYYFDPYFNEDKLKDMSISDSCSDLGVGDDDWDDYYGSVSSEETVSNSDIMLEIQKYLLSCIDYSGNRSSLLRHVTTELGIGKDKFHEVLVTSLRDRLILQIKYRVYKLNTELTVDGISTRSEGHDKYKDSEDSKEECCCNVSFNFRDMQVRDIELSLDETDKEIKSLLQHAALEGEFFINDRADSIFQSLKEYEDLVFRLKGVLYK